MSGRVAIGIDLGGTKVAGGVVDLDSGRILAGAMQPTPLKEGGRAILDCVVAVAAQMSGQARHLGLTCAGVGVGVPELVDNEGRVASDWNFDWLSLDPIAALSPFGPVRLESDVRAGAMAEMRFGRGREFPDFAFVTIGSGMSYALCEGGRVRRGARGFAIHFASNPLVVSPAGAKAPAEFLLEGFASGFGLAETFRRRTGHLAEARDIVEGRAGPEGERLLDEATAATASYLGQLVNMLDPTAVVVAGGLGTAPGYFQRVREKVPPFIFGGRARDLPIVTSALGTQAGVVGAAAILDRDDAP